MSKHWTLGIALLLLVAVIGLVGWLALRGLDGGDKVYVFKGLKGPAERSVVAAPVAARIEEFGGGAPNRLAILVTDPSADWLGLVRIFKAHGVPVTVTTDPAKAMRHRVILAYPIISGRALPQDALKGLAAHVNGGGTLIAHDLAGGGLEPVFGVTGQTASRARRELAWTARSGVPEEDVIRVAGEGEMALGALAYGVSNGEVRARYDDGGAAVVCRRAGGMACLLGVDLGAFAARGMNGRAEGIGRNWVNAYEPSLDVLVRWVRDLYVAGEPMPWLVDTVPDGHEVSILLTHDVDYGKSVPNAGAYGDLLASLGVKGTFLIQTKYIRDYNDEVFYDGAAAPVIRRLVGQGMEIGSHSVSHSRVFAEFPMGSGEERYPAYRPFVEARELARGGTILGELRVSRFLLEHAGGAKVVSFRPGHLSYPFGLPQALQATGYRYSSSMSANVGLTHLPFRLTYDRESAALTPTYEFPVTIEDEKPPLLGERFDAADAVVGKIARHHGLVVVLIHPNVTGHKLAFERRLVEAWRDRAWIGSLAEFGDWWAARDGMDADVVERDGRWVLTARGGKAAKGVAILTPKAGRKRTVLALEAGAPLEAPLD